MLKVNTTLAVHHFVVCVKMSYSHRMKLLTVHAAHFSLLFLLIIIFGATKHDTRLHKGANERRNATHPQQTHASQMP